VGEHTKIIAFIQGFQMSVPASGLSLKDYIAVQVKAAEDAGSGGYIVWNAKNEYGVFFEAISGSMKKKHAS
jgi:hypothetical protein